MEYLDQLIQDLHLVIRNNTIRAEFGLLREHGRSSKDAILKLSEKYLLSAKTIEVIVYPPNKAKNGL